MGTRRRLERRLETISERANEERRAEIAEKFRRLTVHELAILAHRLPTKDNGRLPQHEQEVVVRFQRLAEEAEEVFEQPEILKLVEEAIAENRSHIKRTLQAMGVEPWASSRAPL